MDMLYLSRSFNSIQLSAACHVFHSFIKENNLLEGIQPIINMKYPTQEYKKSKQKIQNPNKSPYEMIPEHVRNIDLLAFKG